MPLRQTYANLLNDPLLASNSINTFTGPQNLIKTTGNAAYVAQPLIIPINYLKPGTTIRTNAWGSFSTTGTPTLVFGVYYGATVLAVNVALTTASGAAALHWELNTTTKIRAATVPSAVVTITKGQLRYDTTLTAETSIPIPGIALATVNVDNSAAAEWSVQATFSASSASNIVVLHDFNVEELTQI